MIWLLHSGDERQQTNKIRRRLYGKILPYWQQTINRQQGRLFCCCCCCCLFVYCLILPVVYIALAQNSKWLNCILEENYRITQFVFHICIMTIMIKKLLCVACYDPLHVPQYLIFLPNAHFSREMPLTRHYKLLSCLSSNISRTYFKYIGFKSHLCFIPVFSL